MPRWLFWLAVQHFFAYVLLFAAQLPVKEPTTQSSVLGFGAKCDWNGSTGTDDTAAFQAAADAAANAYKSSRRAQTIALPDGCVVGGEITYGSGVRWHGHGAIIVPRQIGHTFYAVNANDVAWDNVNITILKPGTSGAAASAISWFSINDPSSQHHVAIRNCQVKNSDWGILVLYNNGTGSLSDVEIAGNTVSSDEIYANGDGIHVAGRVTGIRIHDNHIFNRGDAGIGLTSEDQGAGVYVLSGARVWNNVLTDDLVGLDDSGATNVEWIRNKVKATAARSGAQNPAFRQIYYGSTYPVGVRTIGNYLYSGDNSGSSATVKIDPKVQGQTSWPNVDSVFEKNIIDGPNAPLYVRGRGIVVSGNTFMRGGTFMLDYDGGDSQGDPGLLTANIVVGPNKWMARGSLVASAGCSLYKNVRVAQQIGAGEVTYKNRHCLDNSTRP